LELNQVSESRAEETILLGGALSAGYFAWDSRDTTHQVARPTENLRQKVESF
jgi:hypothetical protein